MTVSLNEIILFAGRFLPSGVAEETVQLAGDASARKYYRALSPDGGSIVVMAAPDEESVSAFVSMTQLMKSLGVDVPLIHGTKGALAALEDLGDTLLQDAAKDMTDEELETEYRKTIDDLVSFQRKAAKCADRRLPCFSLAFDEEKLMWEVEFSNEHFLKDYLGLRLDHGVPEKIRTEWRSVVRRLAEKTETLAHRDLHSRNIMCVGSRRVWIDYQDARMGRRQYDLASLLLDPYVDLPVDMADRLACYYYERQAVEGAAPWSREEFDELYLLSGAQRIYKALGTYGYQTEVRGVDVYAGYIAPSVRTLRRLLESSPALAPLRDLMEGVLPRC